MSEERNGYKDGEKFLFKISFRTDCVCGREKRGGGGRIKYIDVAKFLSVLFVLIDHIQYSCPVSNCFMISRVIWISFFMQIFFISTGITSKYHSASSLKDITVFLEKKVKALLIPYIVWCFFLNMSGNHDVFFVKIILGRMEDLDSVGVNSVLWFLPVLFMANVIAYLIMTLICRVKDKLDININFYYIIAIGLLMIIDRKANDFLGDYLFFGLRSAFCGAALIIFGVCIRELLHYIYINFSILKKWNLSVGLFIVGIPLAYYNMPVLNNNDNISYGYAVWMARGLIGRNVIGFWSVSICLSMAVLVFSMCLEKISIISYWGERSLLFMMLHIYTHSIVARYIMPWMNQYIIVGGGNAPVTLILSFLLIVTLIPLIDRYMPFLYKSI